jgi:hypothetical protein
MPMIRRFATPVPISERTYFPRSVVEYIPRALLPLIACGARETVTRSGSALPPVRRQFGVIAGMRYPPRAIGRSWIDRKPGNTWRLRGRRLAPPLCRLSAITKENR